ncbi:MAG: hypothetical protein HW412_2497 [Bacteroidetes bacterium]|nr:hypothetical protein [Bacteroidota bacterium]
MLPDFLRDEELLAPLELFVREIDSLLDMCTQEIKHNSEDNPNADDVQWPRWASVVATMVVQRCFGCTHPCQLNVCR